MSLNGSIYNVRLLEIDLKQVTFDQDGRIIWPLMENEKTAPDIDGVLLLHDSTQTGKLDAIFQLAGISTLVPPIRIGSVVAETDLIFL